MYFLSRSIFILGFIISSLNGSAQVINAGLGGNTTINLLNRLNEDVLSQNPDLVILMVGTNDMLNSKKMLTYQQYESNLNQLVDSLKSKAIVLMSSPPVDSIYLFERHDRKLFAESPNSKLDSTRRIVERIAKVNQIKFLDLYNVFREMNLPRHNKDLFFRNQKNSNARDGVHLTELGYHFIGETVFHFLKENDLLKNNQKIVCFGDSITKGGGANGNTYPVVLNKKIDLFFKNK